MLDSKLADRPLAVLVFSLDLCLVTCWLALYISLCANRGILLGAFPFFHILSLATIAIYFACREVFQIVNYTRLGEYIDPISLLDPISFFVPCANTVIQKSLL